MGVLNWLFGPQEREVVLGGVRFVINSGDSPDERITVDLLSIPVVANAVQIRMNDLAQIPLCLYLRTDAGRIRQQNLTLDIQLNRAPNAYQNAVQFWTTVGMQATVGECFVRIDPTGMTLLPWGRTTRYTTPSGEVRYAVVYSAEEARAAGLPTDRHHIQADYAWGQVLHFYSSQDESGNPVPLRIRFKAALGLGSALYGYTTNLYNRGGTLAGYLSTDKPIQDKDKMRDTIAAFKTLFARSRLSEVTTGSDVRMAGLDNGWKFNALNLTPQEMMLLETKADFITDVASIFSMPLWKLGVMKDYHYSTAEAAQRDYIQQSLNPLLVQIESECNLKLLAEFERPHFYIEFNREKLISLDAKTMADVDDMAVKSGGMSINEWRSRRNLSAVAGGDLRQVPVNVASATYTQEAELLRLEKLRLEIEQARRDAAGGTAGGATGGAAPTPAPVPAAAPTAGTAPDDLTPELLDMQDQCLLDLGPQLEDPAGRSTAVQELVRRSIAKIASLHGVPEATLETFARDYTAAATLRLAPGATVTPAYEINRCLNAFHHECLRHLYGTTARVQWVGGSRDGQVGTLGQAWCGTLRHPPLDTSETRSFLRRA